LILAAPLTSAAVHISQELARAKAAEGAAASAPPGPEPPFRRPGRGDRSPTGSLSFFQAGGSRGGSSPGAGARCALGWRRGGSAQSVAQGHSLTVRRSASAASRVAAVMIRRPAM
jgi:hypothetical protein